MSRKIVFLCRLCTGIYIFYRAQELVKKVTGQPLSHKPLIDYMTGKFSELYGF